MRRNAPYQPNQDRDLSREVAELQNNKWRIASATYLPVKSDHTIWRYSRLSEPCDLNQGWKLHLSATILSANTVFLAVAPYLRRQGVLFKAPHSLRELQKLNSGLHYGYCQVGKFITVYPRSIEEALRLARRVHHLTRGQPAPRVPFDSKFCEQGSVYYRYGSFKSLEIENSDGTRTPAVQDGKGNLVPDARDSPIAAPHWVADPFISARSKGRKLTVDSPLKSTFRVFQCLAQRGKGGVYKAFDFSVSPPRPCIVKEGRHHGEVNWDGRDGYWLIKHEEEILTTLRAAGIGAPEVYSSFEVDGNYYVVTEFIEGESLQSLLFRRQRRLSLSHALRYAVRLADLLTRIHATGFAWRDCKPANIMVTRKGRLRPVDFEGACPITRPDPMWWSTPAFAPARGLNRETELLSNHTDVYGLGAVIYFLLTGQLPEGRSPLPLRALRRRIPQEVCVLLRDLMFTTERLPYEPEVLFDRLKALAI